MILCRTFKILPWILLLAASGCKRGKPAASTPVPDTPRVVYQEPASETENQSTSAPIVVDTLPKPAGTSTDLKLNIPPPSRLPNPKPPKVVSAEPKRDTKPVEPVAASEPKIVVQTPTIQLAPRISDREKNDFVKKINDQLDSARSLIKSVNGASLGEQQKINLEAIQDFIKKSEDAVTRGEFTQGLVLAEKANTLAASLTSH
jgi:hypothetical protein